jgi:hypothetical protein
VQIGGVRSPAAAPAATLLLRSCMLLAAADGCRALPARAARRIRRGMKIKSNSRDKTVYRTSVFQILLYSVQLYNIHSGGFLMLLLVTL